MTKKNKDDTVVFSVRWPSWLVAAVDEYCQGRERTRNWMIKKRMAQAVGLEPQTEDAPTEDDDV